MRKKNEKNLLVEGKLVEPRDREVVKKSSFFRRPAKDG